MLRPAVIPAHTSNMSTSAIEKTRIMPRFDADANLDFVSQLLILLP